MVSPTSARKFASSPPLSMKLLEIPVVVKFDGGLRAYCVACLRRPDCVGLSCSIIFQNHVAHGQYVEEVPLMRRRYGICRKHMAKRQRAFGLA